MAACVNFLFFQFRSTMKPCLALMPLIEPVGHASGSEGSGWICPV